MMNANTTLSHQEITTESTEAATKTKRNWALVISNWKQSGLSQKAFCRLHNIKYHIFTYHRGKLVKNKKKTSKLLAVQLSPDTQRKSISPITGYVLTLPTGVALTIPCCFDDSSLKNLLALLEVC